MLSLGWHYHGQMTPFQRSLLRCVWPPLCKGPGHVERQFDRSSACGNGGFRFVIEVPQIQNSFISVLKPTVTWESPCSKSPNLLPGCVTSSSRILVSWKATIRLQSLCRRSLDSCCQVLLFDKDWSCALQEGDTLGLLVWSLFSSTFLHHFVESMSSLWWTRCEAMPSGALVLTVNGVRELMVADAGVLADQYLYPIVQVAGKTCFNLIILR